MAEPTCPDGGPCHHECTGSCFRVQCCGPLSGVYPGDTWPVEVLAEHRPLDEQDLADLERQYTPEPVPQCRVCGAALSITRAATGLPTIYAHSKPEGVSESDWGLHYTDSRWSPLRNGDLLVLRLIAEVRRARDERP